MVRIDGTRDCRMAPSVGNYVHAVGRPRRPVDQCAREAEGVGISWPDEIEMKPVCTLSKKEKKKAYNDKYHAANKDKAVVYREKNKEKLKAYHASYYARNRERILSARADNRELNPEHEREVTSNWRKNNPEKLRESKIRYRVKHKEQIRDHQKEYYESNKEKILAQTSKYAKDNADRVKETYKAWREKNAERMKEHRAAYYQANKERIQAQHREYRERNREEYLAHGRAYYSDNREVLSAKFAAYRAEHSEQAKEYSAEWRKNNQERVRILRHNYESRKKTNGGTLSKDIVSRLMSRQKGKCPICKVDLKVTGNHLDHIIPLKLGGLHEDRNMQLTCPRCNCRKQAKHPINFMQEMGYLL